MKSSTIGKILLLGILLIIIQYLFQFGWGVYPAFVLLTGLFVYLNERGSKKGRDSFERSGGAEDQSDTT